MDDGRGAGLNDRLTMVQPESPPPMQTKPKMVSRDPAPGGPRRRRQRDPQPALGYLKGSELWAAWERLAALDRDLAALQPRLPLVPLKLDRQVLVVTAGSAAVAARLRQFEPRLIQGLRARGWLVNRIRFRAIAIHDAPVSPPSRPKAPVPTVVVDRIAAAEDADLPPALREAMQAFVRRQRSYRTG